MLLNKGLNHVTKPPQSDIEQAVVDIESSLKKNPDYKKTVVRNELKPVIKDMKKVKKYKKSVQNSQTIKNLRKKVIPS